MPDGGWKLNQRKYIDYFIKSVDLPIQHNHKLTIELSDDPDALRISVDQSISSPRETTN